MGGNNQPASGRWIASVPLDSQRRPPPLPLCPLLAQERDEARIVPDVIEIVIAHK